MSSFLWGLKNETLSGKKHLIDFIYLEANKENRIQQINVNVNRKKRVQQICTVFLKKIPKVFNNLLMGSFVT